MPWRDPENWRWVMRAEFMAPVLAFITAIVRSAYDRQETRWQRWVLDGLFGALLTVGVAAGLRWIGVDSPDAQYAAGAFIGAAGVGVVRDMITARVRKKVDEL